jgi:signal transduction histidine kinase
VTLEVEDYGIGIPVADREKIFDRFYRTSNGSGKGGYGIGLFLVRHIMDAHGGQGRSGQRAGTREPLPARFPDCRRLVSSHHLMSENRILIIEDEPDLLRGSN